MLVLLPPLSQAHPDPADVSLHAVCRAFCRMSFMIRVLFNFVLSACVSVHCIVPGALSGQKMAPDPRQLGLQMGVSHYVGAGNQTSILLKDATVLNC